MVIYEGKKNVLGKVLGKKGGEIKMCCLEKSWYCRVTRFPTIRDAVVYTKVFNPEVVPKMVFSTEDGSGSTRKTEVLCFHICILQTA